MAQNTDDQRVIRVDRAIRCCQTSIDRVLSTLYAYANEVLEGGDGDAGSIALVPMVAPVVRPVSTPTMPRIVRLPRGGALGVGAVILLASDLLDEIDRSVGRQTLAKVLTDAADGISKVNKARPTEESPDDSNPCAECMRRNALQQDNPRGTVKTTKGQTIRPRV